MIFPGNYIFFDSTGSKEGAIGRLIAPEIALTEACVTFFYAVTNQGNSSIDVLLRHSNMPNDPQKLASLTAPFNNWVGIRYDKF